MTNMFGFAWVAVRNYLKSVSFIFEFKQKFSNRQDVGKLVTHDKAYVINKFRSDYDPFIIECIR